MMLLLFIPRLFVKEKKQTTMKKIILLISISLLFYNNSNAQQVSAYQGGSYQPGIMNVRDLVAAQSQGLIFIDYNYWNNSNGYNDKNGDKVSHLEIDLTSIDPNIGIVDLDFDTNISGYINVPVIYYATGLKILGGRYAVSVAPTILSSNVKSNIHFENNEVISTSSTGGFGDLAFSPFNLSWAKEKIDFSFIYTVYAPIGKYKTGADDNIGKGYWTHQFQSPVYFYFKDKATALFLMPTYEINGQVKDSDVRPGSRLTVEYGISQYVTSWLELEVLNGHNWQISGDNGDGVWWRDTPLYGKDKTNTVSFGVGAWPWAGKLNARLKYAMDYGSQQRFKSNFLSLSFIFIPDLFTGKNNTVENTKD
jgi:hypothetical protein